MPVDVETKEEELGETEAIGLIHCDVSEVGVEVRRRWMRWAQVFGRVFQLGLGGRRKYEKVNEWRCRGVGRRRCEVMEWSSTQGAIAMSSGGAEYYAMVKAAAEGLGIQALAEYLGYEMKL